MQHPSIEVIGCCSGIVTAGPVVFIRDCCGCGVKVGSNEDVLYVDCDGWMLSVEVLVITLFNDEGSDPVLPNEGNGSSEEPSTLLLPPITRSNFLSKCAFYSVRMHVIIFSKNL